MTTERLFDNEINVDPTGDLILDFLIEKDKEEPYIDFKESLDISKNSAFSKTAKDIFAFSNYGGGFILIGFRDNKKRLSTSNSDLQRNFELIGLPTEFHIDQADLQAKFNSFSNYPIELRYREFHRQFNDHKRRFAVIYVAPAPIVIIPIKEGIYQSGQGKNKIAFSANDVLFRRGTQSIIATESETNWIKKRAERTNYKISILSGLPDEVTETIFSNLFEVIKKPLYIWTALQVVPTVEPPPDSKDVPYVLWNNQLVSFEDLSNPNGLLSFLVDSSSARMHYLDKWLNEQDKQKIVINLLNKAIVLVSRKYQMLFDKKKKGIYYPCSGQDRKITWTARSKSSTRMVELLLLEIEMEVRSKVPSIERASIIPHSSSLSKLGTRRWISGGRIFRGRQQL